MLEFISEDDGTCLVPFQGRCIACDHVEDAVTLKFAERVIGDGQNATPAQLKHAADVLAKYGCTSAAEAVEQELGRLRAILFLTETVGYIRPRAEHADK